MRVLSLKSVAARLDVSTKTVNRMVEKGEFPPAALTIGGAKRWYEHDVDLYLASGGKQVASPPPVKGK